MTTLRLIIHGRVQRVGYRDWLVKIASLHKLDGWVRNLTDGTVEAMLSGPETSVTTCLEACRQGPPLARVSSLDIHPCEDVIQPGFT